MPTRKLIDHKRTKRPSSPLILYGMKDKQLRNRILRISIVSTLIVSVLFYGYVEIVKFFSFGGGAYRLRCEMSQILGEQGHDQKIKQQLAQNSSKEGWLSSSLITSGGSSIMTNKKRLKIIGKEKYETWKDLSEHGFPETEIDYKHACKLRPEMMNDTLQQHLPLFDKEGNLARSIYYGKDAAYVEIAIRNKHQDKFLEEEAIAYANLL